MTNLISFVCPLSVWAQSEGAFQTQAEGFWETKRTDTPQRRQRPRYATEKTNSRTNRWANDHLPATWNTDKQPLYQKTLICRISANQDIHLMSDRPMSFSCGRSSQSVSEMTAVVSFLIFPILLSSRFISQWEPCRFWTKLTHWLVQQWERSVIPVQHHSNRGTKYAQLSTKWHLIIFYLEIYII